MERRARATILVLWDVDHTLIETRGVGRAVFVAAFQHTTGHRPRTIATVTGRTELDIFAETAKLNEIPVSDALFERFASALAAEYVAQADRLSNQGGALPGAAEALAMLADQGDIAQSVLTGNIRPVAETKLRAFGLNTYVDFEAGAYGTDNRDRPSLVPLAQARADARYDTTFTAATTVLIGDSPADIDAARKTGARIIAVATGKSTIDQLDEADAALPDLRDGSALLQAIRRLVPSPGTRWNPRRMDTGR